MTRPDNAYGYVLIRLTLSGKSVQPRTLVPPITINLPMPILLPPHGRALPGGLLSTRFDLGLGQGAEWMIDDHRGEIAHA